MCLFYDDANGYFYAFVNKIELKNWIELNGKNE